MKYIYWLVNFLRVFFFKSRNQQVKIGKTFIVKNTILIESGNNNRMLIGNNVRLTNSKILFYGSNNEIIVGDNTDLNGVVFWIEENNNKILIGENTTIEGNTELAACEGTNIEIGKDCMFSHSILVRTTDSHSIIDENNVRINKADNVYIGNHVWVGLQSLILKGSHIPDACVLGARSIVSSSNEIENHTVVVGSPARCVRKKINWLRDRI